MLVRNETRLDQVVYDAVGSALTAGPGTIVWLDTPAPPGFQPIRSVVELAPRPVLSVRRRGELGDLLYLSRPLLALRERGFEQIHLQTDAAYVGLFSRMGGWLTMTGARGVADVDLTGAAESWDRTAGPTVRSVAFANILGIPLSSTRPQCSENPAEVPRDAPVVLQARSAHAERSLPFEAMWELADSIVDSGYSLMVVDGRRMPEWDSPRWDNRCGMLGMEELVKSVCTARGVIGLESGISLLGEALDRPTVMLYWKRPFHQIMGTDWRMKPVAVQSWGPAVVSSILATMAECMDKERVCARKSY